MSEHGSPFFTFNINILMHKNLYVLRNRILDLIEIFITKGVDADSRTLGINYVLGSLTIVSQDAANALPWLYASFIPITN